MRSLDGRWVVFDPIDGPGGLEVGALRAGDVRGVVATNGNHERAAMSWICDGGPVAWASPDSGLPCPPWQPLSPGSPWLDDWEVADLRGGGPGEIAIRIPALDLVVFGDAVIHLPGRGLELLPDKYCADPRALRESMARFLARPFSRALLAHGEPLLEEASTRIAALLS